MKILFLSDDFPPNNVGGAGTVAFNLAKGLQKNRHQVFVITTTRDKFSEGEAEYSGLKIFKLFSNYHERWRAYLSLYNPQTVRKIKKILCNIKPDIVHAHNIHYHLSYYVLKLAKNSGAKVFLTAHDAMLFHYGKLVEFIDPKNPSCNVKSYRVSAWQQLRVYKKRYNPFRNLVIRHYLGYVDKIFAVSNELKKALGQNGIGNVETIYNGIDVSEWSIDELLINEFRGKYNLQNKKIILFGGRLSKFKGAEQIILSVSKVVEEIPNVLLLILGKKDNYVNEIFKLAKKRGLEENIIFTEWLSGEKLKAAYWSSDIIATPSICFDSFPTINLEAMACKKPVISTCFGGAKEIIKDGVTGYIVNPYDVNLMAEKIIDLLKNPQKAKQFGEAGYERVKKFFGLDMQVEKIISWYH